MRNTIIYKFLIILTVILSITFVLNLMYLFQLIFPIHHVNESINEVFSNNIPEYYTFEYRPFISIRNILVLIIWNSSLFIFVILYFIKYRKRIHNNNFVNRMFKISIFLIIYALLTNLLQFLPISFSIGLPGLQ